MQPNNKSSTKSIFFWTRLLNMPFWSIFNMMQMILYKDLHASPLQVTILVALKPIASLFSPYWSLLVHKRRDRLVSNLFWANIIKCLPFLCLLFFVPNPWFIVAACGLCMVFSRGVIPAWMEIIKLNISGTTRERVLAIGSIIEYLGSAAMIYFGFVLDDYPGSWRWILAFTALLGIFSSFIFYRLPVPANESIEIPEDRRSIWQIIKDPWIKSRDLLKSQQDFAHFQIAFALEGAGLIMIQTVLPEYFVDSLGLSYTQIFVALTLCKAVGFTLSSPLWVKLFSRIDIFRFCSYVTLLASSFPLFLIFATSNVYLVYSGFFVYGVMQAGSELGWHMSGPQFSKEHDSSLYSGTNILSIGIRGCIAPLLGFIIYSLSNAFVVFLAGIVLCLLATERMRTYSNKHNVLQNFTH